ncbi:MAG TPA: hypothetical protein VFV38_26790 [Ktedonobacteraceae bacterium]|nr:hypothetical protein [Ktedonobacteraceae bacterium]
MQKEYTGVACSKVIQSEVKTRQDAMFEAQVLERWSDDGGTQASVSNKPVETLVIVQVAAPGKAVPGEKKSAENATETVVASPPRQRQSTLPSWPTSLPGPEVTTPSPGQRLVPTRTDQVTYDCYDQERGLPGLPSPATTDDARESTAVLPETRQTAATASHAERQLSESPPLLKDVTVGQRVYDTQGVRVGKVAVRFPLFILIERGWIFPRVYYVPLSVIDQIEGPLLWLNVSEATLKARDYAQVPQEINDAPSPLTSENCIDISDVSSLGMSPLTPAETGHYHYGPHSPGMNTDAGGSYTQAEIDPRGRLRDRPVKLYITGKQLSSRNG